MPVASLRLPADSDARLLLLLEKLKSKSETILPKIRNQRRANRQQPKSGNLHAQSHLTCRTNSLPVILAPEKMYEVYTNIEVYFVMADVVALEKSSPFPFSATHLVCWNRKTAPWGNLNLRWMVVRIKFSSSSNRLRPKRLHLICTSNKISKPRHLHDSPP